jgi:hypothetical protein
MILFFFRDFFDDSGKAVLLFEHPYSETKAADMCHLHAELQSFAWKDSRTWHILCTISSFV